MINVVVEGESDREAAKAVVRASGREVAKVIPKGGKSNIDPLLPNYNRAAFYGPWVIFRDSDSRCPAELRTELLGNIRSIAPMFQLRLVHPMIEGWLLSDRSGFAEYFGVRPARIPTDTESIPDAKRTLLTLCSNSRSRAIRNEVVLADGRTGPLYTQRINDFAAGYWSVQEAATASESLARAVRRIRELPIP